MAEGKVWYQPGLIFKASSHSICHQEVCRSKHEIRAVDGTVIDVIPELLAEFGVYGSEYTYETIDGGTDFAADIRGGWFDLDSQADQKDWGQPEKEIVARHMLRMVEKRNENFSLWSKPPVGKPWPTIDKAHPKQIPTLAEQLGLVAPALAWVEENKPSWGEAIEKLRDLLVAEQAAAVVEAETEEALTAA